MIDIYRIKALHKELSKLYEEGVLHISNYSPAKVQMRFAELQQLAKDSGISELFVIKQKGAYPYYAYFFFDDVEFYSLCEGKDLGIFEQSSFTVPLRTGCYYEEC